MSGRGALPLLALAVAVAALLAGWAARQAFSPPSAAPPGAGEVAPAQGRARPEFALPDLEGRLRQASEWDGRVLVVNFWATWCAPCRREVPHFVELQSRYGGQGLVTVGIAIDNLEDVAAFTAKFGVNYVVLLGDADAAALSRQFGNELGVLPYTVVVDRQGQVALAHRGEITLEQLEAKVKALL